MMKRSTAGSGSFSVHTYGDKRPAQSVPYRVWVARCIAYRSSEQGQTFVLFAMLLPLFVGIMTFVYATSNLYGHKSQVDMMARSVALYSLSSINGGTTSDTVIMNRIIKELSSFGYSSVITNTTGVPGVPGADNVVYLSGVYGSSTSGQTVVMGHNLALPAGVDTVTVTLTTSVHVTWGPLGTPAYAQVGTATASNSASTIVLNGTTP